MPRPATQSDFVIERAPSSSGVAELPVVTVRTEASDLAARWVMRLTWFVLAALVVLCAVGPHLPAGE